MCHNMASLSCSRFELICENKSVSQQLYAHVVFADNNVWPVLFHSLGMYFTDLGQIIEKNIDVGQARLCSCCSCG